MVGIEGGRGGRNSQWMGVGRRQRAVNGMGRLFTGAVGMLKEESVARDVEELRAVDVPEGELARAKNKTRISLEFALDSPSEMVGWFGGGEILHPPVEDFPAWIARIERVPPWRALPHLHHVPPRMVTAMLNPRSVTYKTFANFRTGVRYLQLLGVRYFVAHSVASRNAAGADPRLRLVATSPTGKRGIAPDTWSVYEVQQSPLVTPLTEQPVVADSLSASEQARCRRGVIAAGVAPNELHLHDWQDCIAVPWFNDASGLDRPTVVVAGVATLGLIMAVLDTTIVNVALDAPTRDLHAPLSTIQGVSTGYLL